MEPTPKDDNLDAIVDHLLKDQSFLMSREIKHKVGELNQLLVQARSTNLKIEFQVVEPDMPAGGSIPIIDVKIYKQI